MHLSLDSVFWLLDSGYWILNDSGFWISVSGFWMFWASGFDDFKILCISGEPETDGLRIGPCIDLTKT